VKRILIGQREKCSSFARHLVDRFSIQTTVMRIFRLFFFFPFLSRSCNGHSGPSEAPLPLQQARTTWVPVPVMVPCGPTLIQPVPISTGPWTDKLENQPVPGLTSPENPPDQGTPPVQWTSSAPSSIGSLLWFTCGWTLTLTWVKVGFHLGKPILSKGNLKLNKQVRNVAIDSPSTQIDE